MIYADSTTVISAIGGLVLACGTLVLAFATLRNGKKVEAVHVIAADVQHQVTTINGRTLAQLGDAIETRRVEAIPPADRTAQEDEHVAVVPPTQ